MPFFFSSGYGYSNGDDYRYVLGDVLGDVFLDKNYEMLFDSVQFL